MNSLSQQSQDEAAAQPSGSVTDDSIAGGIVPNSDPAEEVRRLRKELDIHVQTIEALTTELTSRETQISAILNSRAWRWVCRYSRLKRGYLVPAYEIVRRLSGNGHEKSRNNGRRLTSALLAPRQRHLDPTAESLGLLPTAGLRGFGS